MWSVHLQIRQEAACLVERLLLESPRFPALKQHQVKLTPEERAAAMKAGAVWHHGPQGEPTCAVWKSVVKGKPWYVVNTHRCGQVKPTLKGAIRAFSFVKTTA